MKRMATRTAQTGLPAVDSALEPLIHNVNMLTGQFKNSPALAPLASTAALPEVIAAINTIIERLQGSP